MSYVPHTLFCQSNYERPVLLMSAVAQAAATQPATDAPECDV